MSKFPESFLDPDEAQAAKMGLKPLLLLNALANEDLTLMQAAEKLNISLKTANKYIAKARTALGAKTTNGAVFKALQLGLLHNKK
jgi:molybdenum-dependent DNA-binding transcriptional regulator ModE